MVLAMLATLLPAGMVSVGAAEDTKTIVCVGDSITWGSQGPLNSVLSSTELNAAKYPTQLAELLGSGYTVKNQGRSGNCMYGGGTQTNNQYDVMLYSLQDNITAADTVIIMLGTNDTKYWTDATEHANFVAAYQTMIATFKEWNSELRFILATPPTSKVTSDTAEYSNTLLKSITATITNLYNNYYTDDRS